MTQQELDALPELWRFGLVQRCIDGSRVQVPCVGAMKALFNDTGGPDIVVDGQGQAWCVGWADGVQYKRRMSDDSTP